MPEPAADEMRPPERLHAGELLMRRWRPEDLEDLQRAVEQSIDSLRSWLAWANDDPSSQRDFLDATALGWEQGERFEYAIQHRRDGLLGSVGLMRRIGPGGLEIGYWVHSRHTGKGIAKLATAVMTAAAFDLPWVDHVEIHHDQANLASRGVPAGLGFQMVEGLEKTPRAPCETGVDLIWRLDRKEFPASSARLLLARSCDPGGT
jgi:RimJ/RimL family protein N-acetyltransferase